MAGKSFFEFEIAYENHQNQLLQPLVSLAVKILGYRQYQCRSEQDARSIS